VQTAHKGASGIAGKKQGSDNDFHSRLEKNRIDIHCGSVVATGVTPGWRESSAMLDVSRFAMAAVAHVQTGPL
jgi:hypothetical protein